jgi:hypothetical protein
VSVILRILGLQVLGEAARRLPPAQARMVTVGLAVLANLLPVVSLLVGWMSAGDVFAAYWLELVIIGGFGIVRMLTAKGEPRDKTGDRIARPVMFLVFYGILVTLQAMFLALVFSTDATVVVEYLDRIGFWSGDDGVGSHRAWLPVVVGLFLSHLIALLLNWFARGERYLCNPPHAFLQPFGRMIPMLVVMSISSVGVAAVRFLHLEVLLVALLAAANLSLEFGWTGWLSRIRAVAPLMRALRPPATSSRSGNPRRRTRR